MDSPKYQKIADFLRAKAVSLPIGAPTQSERQLAEETGVSRMTARRAIDELVREGLLKREVGRGTFVARPVVSVPLRLTSFSDDMRARGYTPSSMVIEAREVEASDELAAIFALKQRDSLVLLSRLRITNGLPLAIERTHLKASRTPGILNHDFTSASLYQVLIDEYGVRFEAGEQTIRASIVTESDAQLLRVEPGSAVLELLRTTESDGEIIERTTATYPASRFELSAEITPSSAGAGATSSTLRLRS